MEVKQYTYSSFIYNELMAHVTYDKWAAYIANIVKIFIPKNPLVLDLTAGSGLLTDKLSKLLKTYIIANDLSYYMLEQYNTDSYKICSDIRSLPYKIKFDLVFSNFDSINYLLIEDDIFKAFKEISKILTIDGIFVFDVSLFKNSLPYKKPFHKTGTINGYYYFFKTEYDEINSIQTTTIDVIDKLGQKFQEIHKQKIYPLETFFYLLEEAGLEVIKCYDGFSKKIASNNSKRAQFITKLYQE
ncbi:MAG TPA: methyltransferase domain-containing protein [Ignavibacteriales bacterium]|jgi:SAM-dependent methyltransferase|nr:methyltransferase domain-containing protein [Ignavibacteriales bacterium]